MRLNLGVLFAFIVINTSIGFSQFPSIEEDEIKLIKNSKLFVAINEPEQYWLDLYKNKPDQKRAYIDRVEKGNNMLRYAVESYWTFTEDIIFINASDIESEKLEDKNFTVLSVAPFAEYIPGMVSTLTPVKGSNGKVYTGSKPFTGAVFDNSIPCVKLYRKEFAFNIFLPNAIPTEGDIICGLLQLQYLLKFYDFTPETLMRSFTLQVKDNGKMLQNKTLLLDRELLFRNYSADKLAKAYPFPYKVVDANFIDKAFKEGDDYAVVRITEASGTGGKSFSHMISGTQDGKIYYFYEHDFGLYREPAFKRNASIKLENLKAYAKFVNGIYE